MGFEHLEDRYRGLKAQLEEAYAQPRWNSARIDEIATELAAAEHDLCSRAGPQGADAV